MIFSLLLGISISLTFLIPATACSDCVLRRGKMSSNTSSRRHSRLNVHNHTLITSRLSAFVSVSCIDFRNNGLQQIEGRWLTFPLIMDAV
ncbi:uncharacterized protein F5891DRAFT_1062587 [Suillus fuscotomentosus]|uniref:Secreted protein n=1 Tax=Suillus fuscotomentosus TaxID=1912939 RepID=A0AAD4HFM2_9AGAM|nr:uncharacterized protein F5891DRAFT_1062587 [Suillus fuscotomentosus]KAG1894416.1 hypothetical protein F5891DRAFT_1062587 [Suillus fuscotomentosus]